MDIGETFFRCKRFTNFQPYPNIGVKEGIITIGLILI